MRYEILETDVGQGAGAIAVPVTYGKPVERTDICQPYSVAEVLQTVFHADFQAVLENYVRTETEQIQEAGVLLGAVQMKVRLWSYLKTLSKLQQPTDRTVVDVILQSKLEGQYKSGETRYEDADFRLRYALTALHLFLDMHSFSYHQDIMWIWFTEIRKTIGHSWLHWRRVLKFYEDYILSGDIHPDGKYKYNPVMFDKLPSWCKEAILGLLNQKKREFRDIGTIKSYRCSCTRFCRFLIDHGYESFSQLSPAVIKDFSNYDEHTTFTGRSTCFVIVRAFLHYLDEKGYTDDHGLDLCLMSGTSPQDKIIDVMSDEQLQRIDAYRAEHDKAVELRDIAIVLLGLRMGLRACDILKLSFQDIDWKNRQISIVMKKTKMQITLPMPVEVGNAIYSYIVSGRPPVSKDYIFVRSKAPYGKLTGKVCTKALYRILPERKDVKGGGFHVTRRTFATNLLRNHAGIDDVMDALGHRDSSSVMKYLLLDDERSRKCGLSLDSVGIRMEGGLV